MVSLKEWPVDEADRKLWLALTEACAVATVMVMPYAYSLSSKAIEKARERAAAAGKKIPGPAQLAVLGFVQGSVQFGLVSALGLKAARSMGLGAPQVDALLAGQSPDMKVEDAAKYAGAGAAISLAMLAVDFTAFRGVRETFEKVGMKEPAAWKGLLATFYGGIAEEVLMRLGAQTLAAAGIRRLTGEKERPPSGRTMWPAMAVSNVLFGLGHLPTVARITRITPAILARTLVLNAMGGVVFGYLYWKKGLEAGMLAHGGADLVLHVFTPLLDSKR